MSKSKHKRSRSEKRDASCYEQAGINCYERVGKPENVVCKCEGSSEDNEFGKIYKILDGLRGDLTRCEDEIRKGKGEAFFTSADVVQIVADELDTHSCTAGKLVGSFLNKLVSRAFLLGLLSGGCVGALVACLALAVRYGVFR